MRCPASAKAADMILDQIIAHKREAELPQLPAIDRAALNELPPCRGFREALKRQPGEAIKVIAEAKKGSPSKGIFRDNYDPVLQAMHYVAGGASCMSVLTDQRFFFGHLDHLVAVRSQVDIPLIRKDFIIDDRQIAEARLVGADAILLIVACLEDGEIRDLQGFAHDLGMDVLVEVHDSDEALRAVDLQCDLIGVNNRNLNTFETSVATTYDLLPGIMAPGRVVISESGIEDRQQCHQLEQAGVDGILVGETLMKAGDAASTLQQLRGYSLLGYSLPGCSLLETRPLISIPTSSVST